MSLLPLLRGQRKQNLRKIYFILLEFDFCCLRFEFYWLESLSFRLFGEFFIACSSVKVIIFLRGFQNLKNQ